ncbi:MAG TPA: DinB family protein [Methylomirabilota bacterium]|nr:DinB family protein [Methylomirabilota bacterium]
MATQTVRELEAKAEAAWTNLTAQLAGMEPYLERSDAPGEWTAREVLSHLLEADDWKPAAVLANFAERDLPTIEIAPGETYLTPKRRAMTLKQFVDALDAQRRDVFAYLNALTDKDLTRKARIPLFKSFMGTDEIPLPTFVGAMFDYHMNDHAGQIAKIRKAVGLPGV